MSCLPGKKKSVLPSPPGAVGNPSMGLLVMVCCRSGGLPQVGHMTAAPESPLTGESESASRPPCGFGELMTNN
jgi:hypothetical protein